jgi:hypothetical protein
MDREQLPVSKGLSRSAWGLVAALILPAIGLLWDGAWHLTFGRDAFWSPPHVLLYAGVTLSLIISTATIVSNTLKRDGISIGPLYGAAGAFVVLLGALTMLAAAPFDDWWHNTFGRDSGLWSPPHLAGLIGGALTGLGAVIFVRREATRSQTQLRGIALWATLLLLGCFTLALGAMGLGPYSIRHETRIDPSVYPIGACLVGAFVLVLSQRVTHRAGAATMVALIQFGLNGGVGAALSASGYDRVVSLPPMMIGSALVLDLVFARFNHRSLWPVWAGVLFAITFFPIEAVWAQWLTGSSWPLIPTLTAFFLALPVATIGAIAGEWLGQAISHTATPSDR